METRDNNSRLKRNAILLVGLLCSCCLLLACVALFSGGVYDLYPLYSAHITNMRPCLGVNAETGQPLDLKGGLHATDEQLEVCAQLDIDYVGGVSYPVPLHFLWQYEGEVLFLDDTRMYSRGYIVNSLKPRPGEQFRPGRYRVEVYNGRLLLASTEFLIGPGK